MSKIKNRFVPEDDDLDFDDPAALTVVPEAVVPEAKPKKEPAPRKKDVKENLLAGKFEQKSSAKSYGFYLDDDVVAALEDLAKQNKVSKSKALNTLLRSWLLGE